MDTWLAIFIEAFWDASIIPYGNQNSFFAVTGFNPDASFQAIVLATAASALAYTVNWWIGRWMVNVGYTKQTAATQAGYDKAALFAAKYGWVLLFLVWAPLCNYFTLLAGFFKVKLQVTLPVATASIAAYYIYQAGILT